MDQQSLPTTLDTSPELYTAAPALYGQNVGMQTTNANTNMDAIQKAYQAQQDQEAAMRPIDLAYRQQEVNHMGASGAYLNSEAARNTQQTSQATALQPSAIAAGQGENQAKLGQSQVDVLNQHGDKLGQAAAAIGNLPPNTPSFVIDKMLQDNLGDMYHPGLMQSAWGKQNPQEIGASLKAMSDASYQAREASRAQAQKDQAAMARTGLEVGGRQEVAEIDTASKERQATTAATAKVQSVIERMASSAKDQAAALRHQAQNESDPDKRNQLLAQATQADQIQQAHEETLAQVKNEAALDLSGVAGFKPLPRPSMPSSGGTPPPASPTPTIAPGTSGTQAAEQGFPAPTNDAIAAFQNNINRAKSPEEKQQHIQMFGKIFGPRTAAALGASANTPPNVK